MTKWTTPTLALSEKFYAVVLHNRRVGTLCQSGDHTRFLLNSEYLEAPDRPVLGLVFEEGLRKPYASALRLPRWFSNLLPEGPLREWIAEDRHVSVDREMELLAQVGRDLPGAVQVFPVDAPDSGWSWPEGEVPSTPETTSAPPRWRFSLAGVALKFSMLAMGDRLTIPAVGERGDWLVKFPDYRFPSVPRNEYVTMSMAKAVGIDTPDVRLIHRDELRGVPGRMWPNSEEWAYAVRRFDREDDESRTPVHIEDFAQVRDKYPYEKYEGSFETVAAVAYRGRDLRSLQEVARRIAFSVMVGNGDAHLKNWSLIYPDQRIPRLSPAYDLVATAVYRDPDDEPEDLGLKLCRDRRFESVSLATFARLEAKIDRKFGVTEASLRDVADETVRRVRELWPQYREEMTITSPALGEKIDEWITAAGSRLLASRRGQ
jgi:serine/threonine-protein kinase HipA